MTKREEDEVIKRVLSGDKNAFSDIVTENQKNVYNLVLRMTQNEQDALDISQDVFIKAYTSLSGFNGQSRLSVWLYRIAYNTCLDYIRKNQKTDSVPLAGGDDDSPAGQLPDERYEPERQLEQAELRDALNEAVESLSDEHRQIMIMREYSGMSYSEIGSALGINEGTVKSRLARARRAAADFLIKNGTIEQIKRQKGERR